MSESIIDGQLLAEIKTRKTSFTLLPSGNKFKRDFFKITLPFSLEPRGSFSTYVGCVIKALEARWKSQCVVIHSISSDFREGSHGFEHVVEVDAEVGTKPKGIWIFGR